MWSTEMESVKTLGLLLLGLQVVFASSSPLMDSRKASDDGGLHRDRRFILRSEWHRWPKGIMMYDYKVDAKDLAHVMRETDVTMKRYERHTCIRFYPWVKGQTMEQHGLPDEGHVNYIVGDGCHAVVGNYHKPHGQSISCCDRVACFHEIGHTLGFAHARHDPLGKSFLDGVYKEARLNYKKHYTSYEYDLASPMQGGTGSLSPFREENMAFAKDLQPLIDPNRDNHYAHFKEVTFAYKCAELYCANEMKKCINDGYLGYVEDKCTCVCPVGLDPDTGCQTVWKPKAVSWPSQGARLLAPKEGCPAGTVVTSPFRHSNTSLLQQCHPDLLSSHVTASSLTFDLCAVPADSASPARKWPLGRYCVFREGHKCPQDFWPEYMEFKYTDSAQNAKLEFCCRDDGYTAWSYSEPEMAMTLPSKDPFVLLPYGPAAFCQPVMDMVVQESCLTLNANSSGLEVSMNTSVKWNYENNNQEVKIKYCHYTPISRKECGGVINLDASNPTATILSPNYPDVYDSPSRCYWFVKAPEGMGVILRFLEFKMEESCQDQMEIRMNVPGQMGIRYCGKKTLPNLRSYNHTMMLQLYSGLAPGGKFKIQADLVDAAKHCFNMEDKGATYNGKVNFTRNFLPCLPWTEVTHCDWHAFSGKATAAQLEGNYCRNPDNAFRPWCYHSNREDACVRYYCDVCQLEDHSDNYHDCDQLKAEGFCEKDKKEALRGCAKTCQSSLTFPAKETRKSCSHPCNVADARLVGQDQSPYQPGQAVTCQCQDGGQPIQVTCLSDGSWSLPKDGFVCGACPYGWPRYKGYCYKYFDITLRYVEAEQKCNDTGGILATAKDQREEDVLRSIADPHEKFWIGLDDKDNTGTYVWSDGTTYGPESSVKGTDAKHRCVHLTGYAKFEMAVGRCNHGWAEHFFVCKVKAGERKECKDRRPDCVELLTSRPDMCTEFADFAEQECASTCLVCKNPNPQCSEASCSVPDPTASVTKATAHATVAQGQRAIYKCKSGMTLASGSLERACLPCGKLSGSPPHCRGQYDTPYKVNDGNQDFTYDETGSRLKSYTGNNPSMLIGADGEITQWFFQNTKAGYITLQVWRPVKEGETKYQLVFQKSFDVKAYDRKVTLDIPPCERVHVKAGDTIGIHYPWTPAGVQGHFQCTEEAYPQYANVTSLEKYEDQLKVGEVYEFKTETFCAVFSLGVTVDTPSSCPLPAVPANADQVTQGKEIARGDHVTYKCKDGFQFLSGDLQRRCGSCGQLWGVEPTCGDASTVYEVNRVPLVQRQGFDWFRHSFTGDNPHFRITRSGEITQWKFFSSRAGTGHFEVWRPRPENGTLQFEFVGQNEIYSNVTGQPVTAEVEPCQRIQVQAGDIIGIYYPWYRLGVERTHCNSKEYPGFDVAHLQKDVGDLAKGSLYEFAESGCKMFSMRAVVGPVPTCSLPAVPEGAEQVTSGGEVKVGDSVQYRCQAGKQLLSGDLSRLCLQCRGLDGAAPTCGDDTTEYEVNKVPLIQRGGYDSYKYSITGDNPHFRITRSGEITQWKFFSSRAGWGNFEVWRPRPQNGKLKFEFVGQNEIHSDVTGQPVTADVEPCQRIQVQAGDVIGVYYPWTRLGVERTICNSAEQPGFHVAYLHMEVSDLAKGSEYEFTENGCKVFSMRAVVGPVPTCSLPAVPEGAEQVTSGGEVKVGNSVQYRCQADKQLLSGDLTLGCSACGKLSGATPTCGDASTVYEVNRVPLVQRQGFDWFKHSFTGDNPHFRITRSGEITQWKFFSSRAGWGNFEVWRPRPKDGTLKFEFVGQNEIHSDVTGQPVTADVEPCQRIQVQAGDVIGVYYPWTRLGVERTNCKSAEQPGFDVAFLENDVNHLAKGSVYQFTENGCKMFSMRAVVGPVPTCSLPAVPEGAEQVTSGGEVKVGDSVQYRCQAGKQLLSGDLSRLCLQCRGLDGAAPTCGDDTTEYEVNKVPLIQRGGYDSYKYSITGDNPHFRITRSGEITQWKFFSSRAGWGNFEVWRPRPQNGKLKFEFVGQNEIHSDVTGQPVTADVEPCQRIQVQAGDVIGVYYPWTCLGVERTICNSAEQPGFHVAYLHMEVSDLAKGSEYEFTENGCKVFSMRAVVGPVPTCSLPAVPEGAEQVTSGGEVKVGNSVQYRCQADKQLLSGDLTLGCSACGKLSGATPTCGDASTVYEVNRVPLVQRQGFDWFKHSFTGDNPHFRITRSGEITQWKFFSSRAGWGNFEVWRPRPKDGTLKFEFVGQNEIHSDVTGQPVTADVEPCQRIQVQAGDVIGVYYPWTRLGVERTNCKSAEQPGFDVAFLENDVNHLAKGSVYQFTENGCKMFSMRAVVGPVPTCSLPAVPEGAEQVTSGGEVKVGDSVQYRCQAGKQLLSGDLKLDCDTCRNLKGLLPVCGDASTVYEVNRVPLVQRQGYDSYKHSFTGDNPHFRITRSGEITQWKFFSSRAGWGNFEVWRPRPKDGTLKFEFVGQNEIYSNVTGQPVTADVEPCQRIQVQAGDLIGVYYPWTRLGVERTNCKSDEQPGFDVARFQYEVNDLTKESVYQFTENGCKMFSMRAVVGPVPTCSLPAVPEGAEQVTSGGEVKVGVSVQYRCQAGKQLLSGDLKLDCDACRNLKGLLPVCGDASTVYEVNRVPLVQRQGFDWFKHSFTGDNPHFRITRSGEITQWKFFSSRAGWGNFEVWRPRPENGALQFEFVGQNEIYSNVTGQPVTADVEPCQRIQVQAGDVIGVYYPWYRLGVERTDCKSAEEPGFDVARFQYDVNHLAKGSVYQFTDSGCKMFSMRAVVGPVPTCSLPAVPEGAEQVTSGEEVKVGEMAEYRCKDGFSLLSGDLIRKCLACTRKLEGAKPVCSAIQ